MSMMRMIILRWAPKWGPRDHPRRTSGTSPTSRRPGCSKRYAFLLFLHPAALLSPLSKISHKIPTRARMCVFPRKYKSLLPDYAPDCSHSHIVGAGQPIIILRIIHLALQPYYIFSSLTLALDGRLGWSFGETCKP